MRPKKQCWLGHAPKPEPKLLNPLDLQSKVPFPHDHCFSSNNHSSPRIHVLCIGMYLIIFNNMTKSIIHKFWPYQKNIWAFIDVRSWWGEGSMLYFVSFTSSSLCLAHGRHSTKILCQISNYIHETNRRSILKCSPRIPEKSHPLIHK